MHIRHAVIGPLAFLTLAAVGGQAQAPTPTLGAIVGLNLAQRGGRDATTDGDSQGTLVDL